MFVASNLYKYATGSSAAGPSSASANSRVKRHPNKAPRQGQSHVPFTEDGDTSPPPSYASVAAGSTPEEQRQANKAKYAIIQTLIEEQDLYKLLGIKKNAKMDEIRRGFLNRSRSCHPDKFPNYPPATEAFQKVSFAYEILSKPSSRRMYDVSGRTNFAAAMNNSANGSTDDDDEPGSGLADDTLNGVLYSVFCEFMEGDFEMIRVMVNALNDGNPSMNLGDDAVDSIEGALRRLREVMLAGRRYLSVIKFELIRLYEIQHSLRQLSYFNITGRLKLTLQLARVTINIPLAIDQAMKKGHDQDGAAAAADYESSSESDSEPETPVTPKNNRRTNSTTDGDFGVTSEHEDDDQNDSDSGVRSEQIAEERARNRRRAKRARRRMAKREKRAKLRGQMSGGSSATTGDNASASSTQLQRRGLLPQTAVGLLQGVVMVLETSEAWVPGGRSGPRGSD
ncbi:unnamed protein product [Sympodiomycopsis kandeliae]